MLKDLLESGYGQNKYNCAEKIINAANEVYQLGLDDDATRLFAAFGGGMAVGDTCGAVCSSMGVISRLFVHDTEANSALARVISREFMEEFAKRMGTVNCAELKKKYAVDGQKCQLIIENSGDILDRIMDKYAEQIAAQNQQG